MGEVPADLLDCTLRASTLLLVWLVIRHVATAGDQRATRPVASLRWLGDLSYPLYLLHIPTFIGLKQAGIDNAYLMLVAALLMSAAAHFALESRPWVRVLRPLVPRSPLPP